MARFDWARFTRQWATAREWDRAVPPEPPAQYCVYCGARIHDDYADDDGPVQTPGREIAHRSCEQAESARHELLRQRSFDATDPSFYQRGRR